MKQVTMESIQKRIADLESAGKVVGGLSLSSEFELACLRELVAVTEQRDALVADNVALKNLARGWANATDDRLFEEHGEIFHDSIEACEAELKTICHATDSAIAALRAEGIHFTANRLLAAYDHGFINKPAKEVADVARMIITAIDELPTATPEDLTDSYSKQYLAEIARQLRESKGEVQS